MSNIGAFFDFDQTLLRGESGKIGLKYLWDQGELPFSFMLKAAAANFFYQRHWLSDDAMVRMLLKLYHGRRLEDFTEGIEDFYQEYLKPALSPSVLARVVEHRRQGHALVLISGSICYMLKPVVIDLGFDHLLCTKLEIGKNGLLTGRPEGEICINQTKAEAAKRLSQECGIDLSLSYSYGNHQSDIPLLEMTGYPHAVEPTEPLRKTAARRGWPILGFD